MVLHPLPSGSCPQRDGQPVPAWQAVESKQKEPAEEWWLITQSDHAVLAGDLAARLDYSAIPRLSEEVIKAISAHDAGWAQFDNAAAADALDISRRPASFLDIAPNLFLIAWSDSTSTAERIGPVGGVIVSEHFCRLARSRLASRNDSADDLQRLEQFLSEEACRQTKLRRQAKASPGELELLTDVLQFCDLVSLYLCCGADVPSEFPQHFDGETIRVHRNGDAFLFTPAVFGRGAALGVSARRYAHGKQIGTLPFLLG